MININFFLRKLRAIREFFKIFQTNLFIHDKKLRRSQIGSWTQPKQLVQLAQFYQSAKMNPELYTDKEFIEAIEKTFWGTNCWSYFEAAMAIIAPGCLMRPHLCRELIKHPIGALVAGGVINVEDVISYGTQYLSFETQYVEPSDDGKWWIQNEWPKMGKLINEVFQELWTEVEIYNLNDF